jgi:hypothetical protein
VVPVPGCEEVAGEVPEEGELHEADQLTRLLLQLLREDGEAAPVRLTTPAHKRCKSSPIKIGITIVK